MTTLVDAGPIVAASDLRDPRRTAAQAALRSAPQPLILSPFAAAEADYLLVTRLGERAELAFLQDLAAGTYAVECLQPHEYQTVFELARRYQDLRPGLADLSLIALAGRFRTTRIVTFDSHFRAFAPLHGEAFELLPG